MSPFLFFFIYMDVKFGSLLEFVVFMFLGLSNFLIILVLWDLFLRMNFSSLGQDMHFVFLLIEKFYPILCLGSRNFLKFLQFAIKTAFSTCLWIRSPVFFSFLPVGLMDHALLYFAYFYVHFLCFFPSNFLLSYIYIYISSSFLCVDWCCLNTVSFSIVWIIFSFRRPILLSVNLIFFEGNFQYCFHETLFLRGRIFWLLYQIFTSVYIYIYIVIDSLLHSI